MAEEISIDFDYAFSIEYVKDFNGTRAAERAGHSGSDEVLAVTASRLLRKDKVREYIRNILRTRVMTAEEVLSRTADIARMDLTPYLIKKRNKHYINIDALTAAGLGHLIKEIAYDAKGNQIVKFDDRQGALRDVGKNLGLFSDHHIVETRVAGEVDALLDILQQELAPEQYTNILARLGGQGTGAAKVEQGVEVE